VTNAQQYYASIVLIFMFAALIAGWGFNLQFGYTGVVNLSFIVSQALGAYMTGLLSIGPAAPDSGQHYIFGATLPFPLPLLGGALIGAAFAGVAGLLSVWRLRPEYVAIVTLVIAQGCLELVGNYTPLLNGQQGLANIPQPLVDTLGLTGTETYWALAVIAGTAAVLTYVFVRLLAASPFGRLMRAVRENPLTAAAVGIDPLATRILALLSGGFLAGLSGGILASSLAAWGPSSWAVGEGFAILTALIVGGVANNLGAALGAFVVGTLITQGILFLPPINGNPNINGSMRWVIIGSLLLLFLWFRPSGLVPEPKARYSRPDELSSTKVDRLST
jgi:branched-chain amino acid transport system permease protein